MTVEAATELIAEVESAVPRVAAGAEAELVADVESAVRVAAGADAESMAILLTRRKACTRSDSFSRQVRSYSYTSRHL